MEKQIPSEVLSEHFQKRMEGRRLISAVFLTYNFDAEFFELEVLPIFLDAGASEDKRIRLVELESALRELPGEIAVYYDASAIESKPAHLDFRRLPIHCEKGCFHPKNVFLLTESREPDEGGRKPRTLIVASTSANLTRGGWWENVEACHVEEIAEGEKTPLQDSLLAFLKKIKRLCASQSSHQALADVLRFLRQTDQHQFRSYREQIFTHFWSGEKPLADFLWDTAGERLRNLYLEIISPFLDGPDDCQPLEELVERFTPREVRLYLPLTNNGKAACAKKLFQNLAQRPGFSWGRLPQKLCRTGNGDRFVHAKVYRFFSKRPKEEFVFIGSPNLTRSGQTGRNIESGFLVHQLQCAGDFWLEPEGKAPLEFTPPKEDAEPRRSLGYLLDLSYHWEQQIARALWNGPGASPPTVLKARGVEIGPLASLPAGRWKRLDGQWAKNLEEVLKETSLVEVIIDGEDAAYVLVQEEAMAAKPTVAFRLSLSEIFQLWSKLNQDQRATLLEAHLMKAMESAAEKTEASPLKGENDLFQRFAGIFHAFACLERRVREGLAQGNHRLGCYLLFGRAYDSPERVCERIVSEEEPVDKVDAYVIVLSLNQLLREIRKGFPEFWKEHAAAANGIFERVQQATAARRKKLLEQEPDLRDFLQWFDSWFLRRARPLSDGKDAA